MSTPTRSERAPRGAVLVLVLLMLPGLSLIALGLAHRSRLAIQSSREQLARAQARELAEAGLAMAMRRVSLSPQAPTQPGQPWDMDVEIDPVPWIDPRHGPARLRVTCTDEQARAPMAKEGSPADAPGAGPPLDPVPRTAFGNGKVNLNTAPETVLQTLPGVDATLARRLVAARSAEPFANLEAIQRALSLGGEQLGALSDHGQFHSNTFRIVAQATLDRAQTTMQITLVVQHRDDRVVPVFRRERTWRTEP